MSEQKNFPTVVNLVTDTPSPRTAAPQSWKNFNVTYLRTKTSDWPEHYHRAVQIAIPVRAASIDAHYQSGDCCGERDPRDDREYQPRSSLRDPP